MRKIVIFISLLWAIPAFGQEHPGSQDRVYVAASDRTPAGQSKFGDELPPPNMNFSSPLPAGDIADLPEPELISKTPVELTEIEKKALRLSRDWQARGTTPILLPNGKVTFLYGANLPTIVCSPLMISDIELQPGEIVNDVIVGDTARWSIVAGTSGAEGNESTHLVIKPLDAGLTTTAVVTTDRRTYHFKLVSQPEGHTAYVGFLYPEQRQAALKRKLDHQRKKQRYRTTQVVNTEGEATTADIAKLDFRYVVKGQAPWKPTRVYNDGTRTFIRLPATAKQGEIPVLLVEKTETGEQVLVNYRIRNDAMIVDQVFDKAVLVAGVGGNQEKIEIMRQVD